MACEELEANFDNMMEAYDQAVANTAQAQADLQQAQWAEMGAMGAAMYSWMMWHDCLNAQNGMRAVNQQMQEALSSPEKLKAKVSEMRESRKNRKK
jgi:hypothetical protein